MMEGGGLLEAYLETDQIKTEIAAQELKKTIQELYEKGITADELNTAKVHSKGVALREIETKDEKSYHVVTMEAWGLGYDFLNRILLEIDATTLDEFNAFIRSVLDPEKAVVIVVGPEESE